MQFMQKIEMRFPWFGNAVILITILCLGTFLRLQYLNKSQFPMNDGGFFYVMIRDLQQNGYRLPEFTTYNFNNIPYAYSPLSLYEAAWLNQFFQIDLLKIFLYYPLVFNLLSIPAFYFLAKQLTQNSYTALFATAFYAILNPGYEWLIMGGGLTRSPAQTFFIVSLALFLYFLRTSRKWALALSVISGALMTLHHLEYSWLLAYSLLIFTFFNRKTIACYKHLVILGLGIGLLTSPYWVTVVLTHGISPYLAGFSTGGVNLVRPLMSMIVLKFTNEPYSGLVNILAVIGIFTCISKRKFSLLIWFLAIEILNNRSDYRLIFLPVTVLAAIALSDLLIPSLNQIEAKFRKPNILPINSPQISSFLFAALCIFIPFFLGFLASTSSHPNLSSVNPDELEAMEWVKNNTGQNSSFIIANSSLDWYVDRVGEWFPAIADRHSETTVQGTEWLPDHEFTKQLFLYASFKQCIATGVSCLSTRAEQSGITFTHLFISRSNCTWNSSNCTDNFILTVEDSNAYDKIYENEGVVIYEHK